MSSKGGGGASEEKLSNAPSSVQLPTPGLVIQPDQTTDEGYTRLQVYPVLHSLNFVELYFFQEVGGEGSSAGGSLADLRELERKDESCCSSCAIM